MKSAILAILVLTAVGAFMISCNRKTANAEATTTAPKANPDAPATNRPADEAPAKDAYQVAGYQKTACFGKCPVYQVKFYSDGKVTWYGQMNVERLGWYTARADQQLLTEIKNKAHEAKFWDFSNNYPTEIRVVDLPSTVTYIRVGDMEKTIVDTYQAPAELVAFEDYLAGIIAKLTWQPSKQ